MIQKTFLLWSDLYMYINRMNFYLFFIPILVNRII